MTAEEEEGGGEQEMEEARPQQHMDETLPPPLPVSSSSSQAPHDGAAITGALGGPLYMPGFISSLICVRNFQGSCVTVLMSLQAELNDASIQCADDADILVDDLKIITEEQLVNYALKGIAEEKLNEAVKCGSESGGEKASSASLVHGSDSYAINQNTEMPTQKKRAKKKRGRPFDRDIRGAVWIKDEKALTEESMYSSLRMAREVARRNCTLRSLSLKDHHKPPVIRLDCRKRLQALNFLIDPVKVDTTAVVSGISRIPDFEVVLWIEIGRRSKQQKAQSFLVLGSQMLTALRDKIYCLSDRLMKKANCYTPSGYFHIENFYYNDLRDPAATDYSIPILNWMHDQLVSGQRRSIAYSADMATTQFLDLQCRVGKRYVYCHQGACKHPLVVKDMRLVHKDDVQNALLYPLLRSPFRIRQRKCCICDIYAATKVTFDDKMAPQSPCLFCDYCYYVQHYSQEGTLVYSDFRVYDYYHE